MTGAEKQQSANTQSSDLPSLITQRGVIKGKFTRLINYVQRFDASSDDIFELRVRSHEITLLMDNFEAVQTQIENIDIGDAREVFHEEERSTIETRYYSVKARIEKLLTSQHSHRNSCNHHYASSKLQVKLPKLELPSFDGNLKEWPTFKNLFMSAVDSADIPSLQKFQYLKSSLRGEAAGLISSLLLTEENYINALDTLRKRYENQTIIVNHHLKNFINYSLINKSNLQEFLVVLQQSLDSLKSLDVPVDTWDLILVFLITQKLDNSLRAAWEINRKETSIPKLKELLDFLNLRVTAYELIGDNNNKLSEKNPHYSKASHRFTHVSTTVTSCDSCIMCQCQHLINKCPHFLELSVDKRIEVVRSKSLCYNCLQAYSRKHICSKKKCFTCGGRHHTLIHMSNYPKKVNTSTVTTHTKQNLPVLHTAETTTPTQLNTNPNQSIIKIQDYPQNTTTSGLLNTQATATQSTVLLSNTKTNQILLSTAIIRVQDSAGRWITARALLDSASEVNIVTRRLAHSLQSKFFYDSHIIQGIGDSNKQTQLCINATIASKHMDYSTSLKFIVMDNITVPLPHNYINPESLNIPTKQSKFLADPTFYIPQDIDMLIGAQIFYALLLSGHIQLGPNLPHLIETVLGWVVSGSLFVDTHIINNTQISLHMTNQQTEDILVRFWQQEEIGPKEVLTPEQKYCEQLYLNTTTKDDTGRYMVELPIEKNRIQELGNSFNTAYRCLLQLESRFQKDTALHTQYKEFINEYLELGHAEYVDDFKQSTTETHYYLPHHAVLKPDSRTTKLRTVFNGSAKTSTGVSLNSILFEGPNIYNDVLNIILRFRMYKFVFTCDIVKMFRCILVKPEQRVLQRILWRESKSEPLRCLQLSTVTYGTKCAPYLACRTLKHLAQENKHLYPSAAEVLDSECYMDDCLSGGDSIEQVQDTCEQLIQLLDKGGFKLHKWATNDLRIRKNENKTENSDNSTYDFSPNNTIKTLGLIWIPFNDTLNISIPDFKHISLTKRNVLSIIAQIWDPLGILAPTTITAKILMQDIWKAKIDWDSIIPENLRNIWLEFYENITNLKNIFIPRYYFSDIPLEIVLVGFCDSSQKAYGACLYLRATYPNKKPTCTLIMSKTRVAPIKTQSLPRLELSGALLLSRLKSKVFEVFQNKLNIKDIYLFTDSLIVLHWIKSPYRKLHPYVSHRLMEIIELTNSESWKYINTKQNPADYLTRGILPQNLSHLTPWWHGPSWLVEDTNTWPVAIPHSDRKINYQVESVNIKSVNIATQVSDPELNFYDYLHKYSNFTKLVRIIAFIFKFINVTRNKTNIQSHLSLSELENAHNFVIRVIQRKAFPKEYLELHNIKSPQNTQTQTNPLVQSTNNQQSNNDINSHSNLYTFKSSPLRKLNPFLDSNNIIRVGGRIKHSDISYSQAHPIILPAKEYITTLIVEQYHLRLFHSGIQNTLTNIRLKYWPINGRNAVKKVIHRCVRCIRFKAQACEQQMSCLPSQRVSLDRAFTHVGLDFSGAISIRSAMTRNCKYVKGYICLFVCMASKALHLELVTELSAQAFICALKRFVSRRGVCSFIYSDNATNFHGAYNELNGLHKLFINDDSYSQIINYCNMHNIQWKFTVPLASHMGGLYEAGIKSVKSLLKRQLGNVKLTYELLYTVLVQIEGILNSRPLCSISDVPDDVTCLTPAHFIIGSPITNLPEPNVLEIIENRLSLYQKITQINQKFWSQFYKIYLSELQPRSKWMLAKSNLVIGDIVILKDEATPPTCWPLGKVISVNRNTKDNLVRSVLIKTSKGEYVRPINKLVLLPHKLE